MNHGLSLSSTRSRSTSLLPTAIGIGSALFYVTFTLLPNSNSLMVKWPWVFIWQFGLMLGPIAVLFQLWQRSFRKLGHRIDFIAGAWCLALILSATFAPFSHQAFWYGWAAICNIAFLYALNAWLTTARRIRHLLTFQGILSVIFSGQSLLSWYIQTVLPYQETLAELRTYGVERSFDLQILTLRNWHPIGHQNYVAGYLLLTLPLLVGLAASQSGWRRYGWLASVILSLATLYSTASRGSWFGLAASFVTFIGFSAWLYPKLRKSLLIGGLAGSGAMGVWMLSSDRLRNLFTSLLNADPTSDIAYRLVTNATGWNIGLDHPLFGAGAGSITLLYQKYRPDWAGQTAELTYQLHSTPAQLWAELGLAGALLTTVSLCAIAYLSLRWAKNSLKRNSLQENSGSVPAPIIISIISAIAGYSVYAITDYQLDNICISGILILFTAVLFAVNGKESTNEEEYSVVTSLHRRLSQRLTVAGSGLLLTVSLCLFPVHRAWMLSSQGFLALQQKDIASFVTYLTKAHELAPWEPYYPYQLGWNLGELAFQSTDAQQQEALRQEAVSWFEKAIELSPNREFGYSNLGWLQVNSDPQAATQNFLKSTQLVPYKKGVSFALGYSLLKEGNSTEAVQSMVSELMRQPILLTSPIWQNTELTALYSQILTGYETKLSQQLIQANAKASASLYQILGSLSWWKGDFDKARAAFEKVPTPLNKAMLLLAQTSPEQAEIKINRETSAELVIAAWNNPQESAHYLTKAIIQPTETGMFPAADDVSSRVTKLKKELETSSTFYEWIINSPALVNKSRRLGFGTISRHIDGPLPYDFSPQIDSAMKPLLLNFLFPNSDIDI